MSTIEAPVAPALTQDDVDALITEMEVLFGDGPRCEYAHDNARLSHPLPACTIRVTHRVVRNCGAVHLVCDAAVETINSIGEPPRTNKCMYCGSLEMEHGHYKVYPV